MRLTWKDATATILVAAIVVPYVGYLIRAKCRSSKIREEWQS
jgi:hypothetical protein